ncbi:MAG: sugar transferase [Bacteroidota bacterium]|nr:MAG: sugar transferase [Bacteroidota bacterium]
MKPIKALIRKYAKVIQRSLDLFITVVSYFGALYLISKVNGEKLTINADIIYLLLLVLPTWAILIKTTNLAQIPRSRTYLSIFFRILNFNLVGLLVLLIYKHLFNLEMLSHQFVLAFSFINWISLFTLRMTTFRIVKSFRANGHNIHNIVVIADKDSEELIDSILDHKEWGYRIVAIFSDSSHIRSTYSPLIRVLPERSNIKNILKVDIIDEVLYCKNTIDLEKVDRLIEACKELGVTFKAKSKVMPVNHAKVKLTHLEKTPFLTFINTPNNSLRWAWKSISDFMISAILMFFLSPLFLTISLIIRATSKGPAMFKQKRVGLHGRQFYIYKFRTMVQNAEELKAKLMAMNESDGPTFKMKHDPRITAIGRFLRKTSIDELPQLINVLRGEMSLIGPRPPLPSEVAQYEDWQLRRLSVKPGITCTWQIIPNRNEVVFEKWMKLDMEYIDKWSYKSDWQLFFRTIKSVLVNRGY